MGLKARPLRTHKALDMDRCLLQVSIMKDAMNPAKEAVYSCVLPHPAEDTKAAGSGPEPTADCILEAQTPLSMVRVQHHDVKLTDE